jgi:hypothetical protein
VRGGVFLKKTYMPVGPPPRNEAIDLSALCSTCCCRTLTMRG